MSDPLEAYVACTRLVFSVEPSEPSENWDEFEEFEEKLCKFYESLKCKFCGNLLIDPCAPKKQHISCQHRVCLECIGKNRLTVTNCKMCRDFTLFEKSNQTKLVLRLFQELCELIKGSWIYDYIQRRTKPDTGQREKLNLTEIIENGINYGQTPIVLDDSSSSSDIPSSGDENDSNSSMVKESPPSQTVPYSSQALTTFPSISPLAPISPQIVQSPEPTYTTTILPEPQSFPIISPTTVTVTPQVSPQIVSQIVTQYPVIPPPPPPPAPLPSHIATQQIQLPSTSSKISTPQVNPQPLLKTPSFVPQVSPLRVKPIQSVKSIMSPMKIQQAPTIYSVMYTGSGNKITLKRKTPSDEQNEPINSSASNNDMNLIKTDSVSSNFKASTLQLTNNAVIQSSTIMTQHQQQIPIVAPIPSTAPSIQHQQQQVQSGQQANNPNEKRRGCRCGNATAAPGKLTCCGQRCPCYVDSKACIDCKCRGCRNPHYADGQKKLRHFVPDLQAQQQQQQDFLASLQNQTTMIKEVQKVQPISIMKNPADEISLIEPTVTTAAVIGKNSINNCIISMNSNGQYQIKPRIIMKDSTKTTMSPIIFPTTSATNNSSIQILGLYSQVTTSTAVGEKKIIIKNEAPPGTVMTFTEAKPHLLEPSATNFTPNNLNSNLL